MFDKVCREIKDTESIERKRKDKREEEEEAAERSKRRGGVMWREDSLQKIRE